MFRPHDHEISRYLARLGIDDDDLVSASDSGYGGRLGPDGTVIQVDPLLGGCRLVRPGGREQLRRRLRFWTIKRDQTTSDFNSLKRAITDPRALFVWPANRYGPGSGNAIEDLKHLQSLVLGFRKCIAVLEAALDETEEEDASRARVESDLLAASAAEAARLETARLAREITI